MLRGLAALARCSLVAVVSLPVLTASSGCAALTYRRSQPVRSPEVERLRHGHAVVQHLPGIDLSVAVDNRSTMAFWLLVVPIPLSGWSPTSTRLRIWLEIDPTAGPVTFDPSAVTLVSSRGDTLRPLAWYGPGGGSVGFGGLPELDGVGECRCEVPRDGDRPDWDAPFWKRRIRPDTSYTEMSRRRKLPPSSRWVGELGIPSCFVLVFDGRRAGHDFTLRPGRLDRRGQPIEAHPVRYEKGFDSNAFLIMGPAGGT